MRPYVLVLGGPQDLLSQFRKIRVDAGGSEIMLRKGFLRSVKIHGVRPFPANILKQEMLSLGGDAAVSRGSLTGRDRKTDCLLLGTLSQFSHLEVKLQKQPFALAGLGREIAAALENFERKKNILDFCGRRMRFGEKTAVMGIINTSIDSFSGDGKFFSDPERGLVYAQDMAANGADMLDIGGESTRPGSERISAKEETARVLPLLKKIAKRIRLPISIDTMKSEVASAALDAGASIVNDVSALRFDKKMARIIGRYGAGVVLTHMKGTPRTMQAAPYYGDCIGEIMCFLADAVRRARDAGIAEEKIIVDPGIGFGKGLGHNLEILSHLSSFRSLGRPLLIGLSRKWFIGKILQVDVHKRIWGTAAAVGLAIAGGADIVRVHDVREMKQVVKVADAIVRRKTAAS